MLGLVLFGVSLAGGFCSGLLGVGGAVVLIPLLLSVPPLVGAGMLDMHQVAGITMIQVLGASAMAAWAHRRTGGMHLPTVLWIGIPMGLFAFSGAAASSFVDSRVLEIVFGCIVAVATLLLLRRSPGELGETDTFAFSRVASSLSGSVVGFASGMVGAGGGFVLIPVMTSVLRIPIKKAVGSSLGIVFIGALMGSIGKIVAFQVEWQYLIPVLAGSLPASLVGARISRALRPTTLRLIFLSLVILILIKTWWGILM